MGEEIDQDILIQICLLHDVGNIIKFDLEKVKNKELEEYFEAFMELQL
ncbi:hypothetical protein GF362_00620 [Candidatus Dojkabacteria bacterium]|nr:hypothetical protein [Candidatus Dojkabacteria bacterium]